MIIILSEGEQLESRRLLDMQVVRAYLRYYDEDDDDEKKKSYLRDTRG